MISGYLSRQTKEWGLNILNGVHNHAMESALEGLILAGRLKEDDKKLVRDLTKSKMLPRNILIQLNAYFVHIGENQHTRHLFAQMPCIEVGEDIDEYVWKRQAICLGLLKTIATLDLCFRIWWKIIYYTCMFVPYAIVLNVLFNLTICHVL